MAKILNCCSPCLAAMPFRSWTRGKRNSPACDSVVLVKSPRRPPSLFETNMAFVLSPLMAIRISHDPAETEAIGFGWGREAVCGSVIALSGELGAGKTQLVKGIARGLGVTSTVHSPTFSLVNIYAGGRLTLFHLDLYRLAGPPEVVAAGLEEYLTPNGVAVIEWAEKWFGDFGAGQTTASASASIPSAKPFRWTKIEHLTPNERRITYEDFGD